MLNPVFLSLCPAVFPQNATIPPLLGRSTQPSLSYHPAYSRRFRNPSFAQKSLRVAKGLLWLLYQHNCLRYADTVRRLCCSFDDLATELRGKRCYTPFLSHYVVAEAPKLTTNTGPPIRRRWRHQFPRDRSVHRGYLELNVSPQRRCYRYRFGFAQWDAVDKSTSHWQLPRFFQQ